MLERSLKGSFGFTYNRSLPYVFLFLFTRA